MAGDVEERLGTAMSEAWPAEEQLVDDSEVWHRFAPLVVAALAESGVRLVTEGTLASAFTARDHELGRCPAVLDDNQDAAYHRLASNDEARAILASLSPEAR